MARTMKPVLPLALLALAAACAAPLPKNPGLTAPPSPPVAPEHEWLAQLAGHWDVVGEADMGPEGKATMRWVANTRTYGAYWVVAEIAADFGGVEWRGLNTIGWDPNQGVFIGTWFDSTNHYLWHYQGSLDASRRVLTMEATGPSMMDPSVTTHYRDVTEIVGPNEQRISSWMMGPDGEWMPFMQATAKRRG